MKVKQIKHSYLVN